MDGITAAHLCYLTYQSDARVQQAYKAGAEETDIILRHALQGVAKPPQFFTVPCCDSQAYVLQMADNGPTVVAVRGTNSLADAMQDLHMCLVPLPGVEGDCRVHCGFMEQYQGLHGAIEESTLLTKATSVVFVGHSLGSAVSALLSLAFALKYPDIPVYYIGLGSPRVGDANFCAAHRRHLQNSTLYVNGLDPVPKVPGGLYRHICEPVLCGNKDLLPWFPNLFAMGDHDIRQYVNNIGKGPRHQTLLEQVVRFCFRTN